MTDKLIKEQVKIIEKATSHAAQSKETAIKFLKEAGIIHATSNNSSAAASSNKKTK